MFGTREPPQLWAREPPPPLGTCPESPHGAPGIPLLWAPISNSWSRGRSRAQLWAPTWASGLSKWGLRLSVRWYWLGNADSRARRKNSTGCKRACLPLSLWSRVQTLRAPYMPRKIQETLPIGLCSSLSSFPPYLPKLAGGLAMAQERWVLRTKASQS